MINEKSVYELLYLLNGYVNNRAIDKDVINSFNLEEVYVLAYRNALTSLIGNYLMKQGVFNDEFNSSREAVIACQIQLEGLEKELCAYLNDNKMEYILLKGSKIKDYYPEFGIREMGDLDIYLDKKYRKVFESYMKQKGFTKSDNTISDYHDNYMKKRFQIENHFHITRKGLNRYWDKFIKLAIKNAQRVNDSYQYELSKEDHYVYLLMHGYRHKVSIGIGLRFLLDIYYYRQKLLDQMDVNYIEDQLNKLELSDFEKDVLELIDKLFIGTLDYDHDTDEFKAIVNDIVLAGVVGFNRDGQIIKNRDEVKGENIFKIFKYALKELDKDPAWYRFHSRFAYKHKWFRPIYLFYVSVKEIISNPNKLSHYKEV